MAVSLSISPQDVTDAANFLESYLEDSVTDGDFTKGTALRDLSVGALAAVYALLRADSANVRQMQSLNSVQAATGGDPEALRDAVLAILSNVFITPKSGSKSRGVGLGHVSQQTDVFVQPTHRFTYSPGLVFVVDSSTTYFVSKTDLIPVVDADNQVLEYTFRIPLVAVATGDQYDVDPGLFASFDRFNPYVTKIEVADKFSGGKGPETVDEILARAPTALSVRNLINDRSIRSVLEENFDEIRALFIAGMGDPEMQRDRLPGQPSHLAFHVGGMTDIYLLLDLVETTFTGTVGDLFERPDGVVNVFRDGSANFAAVQVGDVLRITAGLPVVPKDYLIVENLGNALIVAEQNPFSLATDEQTSPTNASYTIGRIAPNFTDVLSGTGGIPLTTGTTSRRVATSGRITLPGGPVMDILDVAILNPPGGEAGNVTPLDGFIHFTNHVNGDPANNNLPTALEYSTTIHNNTEAQSASMWMELQVGPSGNMARFDGLTLRVRYRTLTAFTDIDAFVRSKQERTSCANQLPRGHNPVSISLDLNYKLKSTAAAALDDGAIAQAIVNFISTFDTSVSPIDVSGIVELVRNTYPDMQSIMPLTITYQLLAPTGELVTFQTSDEVRIDATKQTAGPVLDLAALGVTDRTVRYIANTIGVTANQVG